MNTSTRCYDLLDDIQTTIIKELDIIPEKYQLEKVYGPGGYVKAGRALFDWVIFYNNPKNKNETIWMSLTGPRLECDYFYDVVARLCLSVSSRHSNISIRDEIIIEGNILNKLHLVEYHFKNQIKEYLRETNI